MDSSYDQQVYSEEEEARLFFVAAVCFIEGEKEKLAMIVFFFIPFAPE
jgi:hypothetical protein